MAGLPLSFSILEGDTHNRFWKDATVAAHVLARSGRWPRLIVAFAAGNEGAGLWFDAGVGGAELELPEEVARADDADGTRGITTVLKAGVRRLYLSRAVLGSVRLIRAHSEHDRFSGRAPVKYDEDPGGLELSREVGEGRWLRLRLEPLAGTTLGRDGDLFVLRAAGRVQLRITALSGAAALTPVAPAEILRAGVEGAGGHLQALAFLAFEEKLLAGSWRFMTYFGRDTLLAARLLAPVLHPRVMESALGSVLDRLGPGGGVAHEEEIGDWARIKYGAGRAELGTGEGERLAVEEPIYDYKMVDDDFMLAPVVANYLLGDPEGRLRAAAMLERRRPDGEPYLHALRRNLEHVLDLASPYAADPSPQNLISLGRGLAVGNWRDSEDGLGGGSYPFDVNAVLVPSALTAAAQLFGMMGADKEAEQARRAAQKWDAVWQLFDVRLEATEAESRVRDYANSLGLDPHPALESLQGGERFSALALDHAGEPIPVMHTDGALALLFGNPTPRRLRQVARLVSRPFPAGLRSTAGIVVANPVLAADAAIHERFTANHYHGTVVWSWQQALLAAGFARQLQRRDLPAVTRGTLREAEAALWDVIRSTHSLEHSELWSWALKDGVMAAVPFGQRGEHLAESNAVQLWSTVYLSLTAPELRCLR